MTNRKESSKIYYDLHREEILRKRRLYKEINKEAINKRRREIRQENLEEHRNKDKEDYNRNKERHMKRSITYRNTINGKYSIYQRGAIRRNIKFDISIEDFTKLWNKPCYYCNSPISSIGLDRIDSSQSYTIANVVSCCSLCNYMKREYPLEIFSSHIMKIYKHFIEKHNNETNLP
jgi:hypothetical protein